MKHQNISVTGSLNLNGVGVATTANLNAYTASSNSKVDALIAQTGSYATTGSNTFTGAQVVQGTLTAQTLVVQTVTSSVLFSTGSNIIGSSLSNIQQLTGSVGITGSLAINGTTAVVGSGTVNELAYFTASGTIASLPVATYPSLTELSYVKGVTSAIQTQLNAKASSSSLSSYLLLTGGTLTGSLYGTSAIFGSDFLQNETSKVGISFSSGYGQINSWGANTSTYGGFKFQISVSNGGTYDALKITPSGNIEIPNYVYARKGTSGVAFTTSNAVNADWEVETTSGGLTYMGTSGNLMAINRNGGSVVIGRTTAGLSNTTGTTLSAGAIQAEGNSYVFYGNRTSSDGLFMGIRRNNVDVGSITVTTSATAFNTSSDYRLKTDFKDYNGLSLINSIKTYDYAWAIDNTRAYGVKAHELQELLPYMVFGEKDATNDDDSIKPQAVDYSKLVPVLVKAIQEQQVQIEELKTLLKA